MAVPISSIVKLNPLSFLAMLFLNGCATNHETDVVLNEDARFYGQPGQSGNYFVHGQGIKQARPFEVFPGCVESEDFASTLHFKADSLVPQKTPLAINPADINSIDRVNMPLSPGDLIEIVVEEGNGISGRYIVDASGFINVPLISPVKAAGETPREVARNVELALIKGAIFQPASTFVSAQVLQWSSIDVAVAGAVFQPGRVFINARNANNTLNEKLGAFGDFAPKRFLSEAIRAAHGIRPDAKLDHVLLQRGGWQVAVDLTGIMTGDVANDFPLVSGDRVIVPSTGCFQAHLVRPSRITPKGFRVFMSNLIDSAMSNSSAAVGRYSTNIPYGTRLLQAAISANCVGGKEMTNAPRKVVLASVHPITGKTQVIERGVETLMRHPNRESINPFLMPNDAIACYDSGLTNWRDVARAVSEFVMPFRLL